MFAECKRVLEPGGRIAVNVANLGRRPYRSLSGDVTTILQDLGLLLRGEVVWWKGRAAGGSCAWGTFQRPANPVLRDVTERVVIASKGRFDRALTPAQRVGPRPPGDGDHHARRVHRGDDRPLGDRPRERHPGRPPGPVPRRAAAAPDRAVHVRRRRRPRPVHGLRQHRRRRRAHRPPLRRLRHRRRLHRDGRRPDRGRAVACWRRRRRLLASDDDAIARAVRDGAQAKELARLVVEQCGFTAVRRDVKPRGLGITLDLVATDRTGHDWAFDTSGSFTSSRNGLRRTDTLWRALGKAAVLHSSASALPLVLVTTDAPTRGTPGHQALTAVRGPGRPVADVVELLSPDDRSRLSARCRRRPRLTPVARDEGRGVSDIACGCTSCGPSSASGSAGGSADNGVDPRSRPSPRCVTRRPDPPRAATDAPRDRPRGDAGNRTRVDGFAGRCLNHSATSPLPARRPGERRRRYRTSRDAPT